MLTSLMFPMVQLAILGNAFGGQIRHTKLGVVDEDRGPQALRVVEMLRSVPVNANTFSLVIYDDQRQAVEDVL